MTTGLDQTGQQAVAFSIAELVRRIQSDRLFRLRFLSRMAEVLVELGADPGEVSKGLPNLDVVPKSPGSIDQEECLFIIWKDTKRNYPMILPSPF